MDSPPSREEQQARFEQAETERLAQLSWSVATYRTLLLDHHISDDLADVLVRDWHQAQLQMQINNNVRLSNYTVPPRIKPNSSEM